MNASDNISANAGSLSNLDSRRILLILTGGISAYKSCILVREVIRAGGEVRVVMTAAAEKFISPLTLSTLSGNAVMTEMFPEPAPPDPIHLQTSEWADIMVVAPATANFLGKLTNGLADDLASSIAMAYIGPVLLAPAMNPRMWSNQAVQDNVHTLEQRGYRFTGPHEGAMGGISEQAGVGRMSEPEDILNEIEKVLFKPKNLEGRRILISSGPTREKLDPVRYLSNFSSGKMGHAIARQAQLRGAEVTLIRGKGSSAEPPRGINIIDVDSAAEMADAMKNKFNDCDMLIMAAAVADWTIENVSGSKIKKRDGAPQIEWKATEDILKWASENKKDQIIIGFALETANHLIEAQEKFAEKGSDIIALNDPTRITSAFGGDTIQLTLISHDGKTTELTILSTSTAAGQLLDFEAETLGTR